MCEAIAQDWNREQLDEKKHFTWSEIWSFPLITEFPALYVPQLYDAAKQKQLVGLLLTDSTCAKMFVQALEKK